VTEIQCRVRNYQTLTKPLALAVLILRPSLGRGNFIGNAWSNLKNKVARKSIPTQVSEKRQKMLPERYFIFLWFN